MIELIASELPMGKMKNCNHKLELGAVEMEMREAIAYFITWTCYGTWLPGDERGWNDWHQGWKSSDPKMVEYAQSIMTEEAVALTPAQRLVVASTIDEHCKIREWHIWASNCRTNHVHSVITANGYEGAIVRDQLKAWCTRKLKARSNIIKKNWWTEGGFVKKIYTEDDLAAAIQYTNDAQ